MRRHSMKTLHIHEKKRTHCVYTFFGTAPHTHIGAALWAFQCLCSGGLDIVFVVSCWVDTLALATHCNARHPPPPPPIAVVHLDLVNAEYSIDRYAGGIPVTLLSWHKLSLHLTTTTTTRHFPLLAFPYPSHALHTHFWRLERAQITAGWALVRQGKRARTPADGCFNVTVGSPRSLRSRCGVVRPCGCRHRRLPPWRFFPPPPPAYGHLASLCARTLNG